MTRHKVVLYNVQRLLGLGGSPVARALDATAAHGWNLAAYQAKVARIGAVLRDATGGPCPAVLFLIEVEDAHAVADVTTAAGWPQLVPVVPASEQVAGWDVAIAYDPAVFTSGVTHAESHVFSNRFSTRDLLVAHLSTGSSQPLVVMGTHWPSRKVSSSQPERYAAASYCDSILEGTLKYLKQDLLTPSGQPQMPTRAQMLQKWRTPIIVAGDFNDEPWDASVRVLRSATPVRRVVTKAPVLPRGTTLRSVTSYLSRQPRLFNPTWNLDHNSGAPATYYYNSDWHRIDQILVSAGMLTGTGPRLVEDSLHAHHPRSVDVSGTQVEVTTPSGYPRPFDAKTLRGVSDHLPLVAEIEA